MIRELVSIFPRNSGSLSAVSYTHLDVYKRQGLTLVHFFIFYIYHLFVSDVISLVKRISIVSFRGSCILYYVSGSRWFRNDDPIQTPNA